MTNQIESKLDNPVWNSLSENHSRFCVDYGHTKFYRPDYTPFGAFINSPKISDALLQYSELIPQFYVVGEKPELDERLTIQKELVCLQMVINKPIMIDPTEEIVQLNKNHFSELYDLANLMQPGYFKRKTHELGKYFGIFKADKLVAVTGERMKMEGLTEVSAVVTHMDHGGKGYAKQLVAHTVNNIFQEGRKPFLHVAATNTGAIALYERLGFATRRKISFWNIAP